MTCIAAISENNIVYMAADSCAIDDNLSQDIIVDKKVFINNGYLFGFTSSFRFGQILKYSFVPPKPLHKNLYKFLCNGFIDSMVKCMKKHHFDPKSEEGGYGEFLLGVDGQIFRIDGDLQVLRSSNRFDACGIGAPTALGSLFSTPGLDPHSRLNRAMEAAAFFNAGVRSPFDIIQVP